MNGSVADVLEEAGLRNSARRLRHFPLPIRHVSDLCTFHMLDAMPADALLARLQRTIRQAYHREVANLMDRASTAAMAAPVEVDGPPAVAASPAVLLDTPNEDPSGGPTDACSPQRARPSRSFGKVLPSKGQIAPEDFLRVSSTKDPQSHRRVGGGGARATPTLHARHVVVLVDHREKHATDLRQVLAPHCEVCALPAGDIAFAIEQRQQPPSSLSLSWDPTATPTGSVGALHMLPVLIERKEEADLAASVQDARYHSQKVIMRRAFPPTVAWAKSPTNGLRLLYLVEQTRSHLDAVRRRTVTSACASTGLRDGFGVLRAATPAQVGSWIRGIQAQLTRSTAQLTVSEICTLPTCAAWTDYVNGQRMALARGLLLPRVLQTIRGVTHRAAVCVARRHRTLVELQQAVSTVLDTRGDLAAEQELLGWLMEGTTSKATAAKAAVTLRHMLTAPTYDGN